MNELVAISPVNVIACLHDDEPQAEHSFPDLLRDQTYTLPADHRVTIVSRNPGRLRPLMDLMRQRKLTLEQVNPDFLLKNYARFVEDQRAILVVVLDDCGGSSDIISSLLDFRFDCPATQVILVSAEIASDDLTCERLPLCDISLKWPLSEQWLVQGLEKSHQNNKLWQARLIDMGYLAQADEGDLAPGEPAATADDGCDAQTSDGQPESSGDGSMPLQNYEKLP